MVQQSVDTVFEEDTDVELQSKLPNLWIPESTTRIDDEADVSVKLKPYQS